MNSRGYFLGADWSRAGVYNGTLEDLSGNSPTTCYVEQGTDVVASWGRDQNGALADATVGTMSFALVNDQRQFSPENTLSPVAGKVLPGTPVMLAVTDPATAATTTVATGPIDTLDVDPNAAGKTFSATCSDGWGKPGDTQLSTPVYTGMRTGDLIGVILDAIGWPTAKRAIDPGATLVPYWWAEGQDAAGAVNDLVHSEGPPAIAYVQGGVFYFRDRHHRLLAARSQNSQGWFTHLIPAGSAVLVAADAFARTVAAGGWGTADTGGSWTVSSTSTASLFSVSSGAARISQPSVSSGQSVYLTVGMTDADVAATFSTPVVATGAGNAAINGYLLARRLDDNNRYMGRIVFNSDGLVYVALEKTVAGSGATVVGATSTGITYATNTGYRLRFQLTGNTLRARVWAASGTEPSTWQVSAVDTDLTAAGTAGVRAMLDSGNTNTSPVVLAVDDVQVSPLTDHKILRGSFGYNNGLTNIINSATLEVTPRIPGDRQEVWSSEDPITLAASETVTIIARLDDPAVDLQTPTAASSDFSVAAGSISAATLSRTSGQSVLITLTAGGGGAFLDGGIRLRGTPLRQGVARLFTSSDPSSENTFGANDWGGSAPWAYFYDAAVLVNRVVSVYGRARPQVTFDIDGVVSAAALTQILGQKISDRITVRNDEMGLNADFVVERLTHTVQQLGLRHRLTIGAEVVEPMQAANPFTFDVSGKGFNDGQFGMDGGNNPATMFMFDVAGKGFNDGLFAA